MFNFVRHHWTASQGRGTVCIPTSNECAFLLLLTLTGVGVDCVLDFGHSNKCVLVCHWLLFYLHFPDDVWCGTSSHMIICHLYIFSGEVSVKVFGTFLNWVFIFLLLSFKSSLHIVDSSPFPDVPFANITPQVHGSSSHSIGSAFRRAEVLNFNEGCLVNDAFPGSSLFI